MRSSIILRGVVLGFIAISLGYFPEVIGPGIDAPSPMGPYLNGAFPDQAPATMTEHVDYGIENAFPNLTFIDPLDMAELPDGNIMLIGKPGFVWVFENDPGAMSKELVLDISAHTILGGDSGLLGLVLHPDFANNGYFYLWYRYTPAAGSENAQGYMRLERFTLQYDNQGTPFVDAADPEHVLIQQFDSHNWHNGGDMFFGPDGFLYLSIGDEGGANDQFNTTQRLDQWLFGGVLRIDVDQQGGAISHPIERQPINPRAPNDPNWPDSYSQNYYIPNDNPWTGSNGQYLEEFFSIGTRSPHRMTYDPVADEIWIGDVGQGSREEVSVIDRGAVLSGSNGANLQWPYREGDIAGPKAKPSPLIGYDNPPIFAYPRSFGNCVIGGYVSRSALYPELEGKYLFSDHTTQNVYTLEKDPGGGAPTVEFLLNVPFEGQGGKAGNSSFGMTADGTLYILDLFGTGLDGGKIHKLVRNLSNPVPDPPERLSDIPAFEDLVDLHPLPGLIPYDVNTPLWSDRARKSRWLVLPNDGTHNSPTEQIRFSADDNWQFPPGTVAVKHFELPIDERDPNLTTRLETRFLIFDKNGGAYGLTYRWNDTGTEAFLLRDGETRDILVTRQDGSQYTQTWQFPDRQQCMTCHTSVAGFGLGLNTSQINRDFLYPSGILANQLETWNHLGLFNREIGHPSAYPQLADLGNGEASLEFRLRSYLDANCAHCHQPNGVQAAFDARTSTALHDQQLINAEVASSSSIPGGIVVRPGLPETSSLWIRDNSLADNAMPPLAKNVLDEVYLQTLHTWISGLAGNAPEMISEGWYLLEARHSLKVLGSKQGFTYDNAEINQQSPTGGSHQNWYARHIGGNKFVFINEVSGLFLSIEDLRSGQEAKIVQQEWHNGQNQMWYIESPDAGYYNVKSAYNSLEIGIADAANTEAAGAVTALPDSGDPSHQFTLLPLSGAPVVFEPVSCSPADYVPEILPPCRYTLKLVDSEETAAQNNRGILAIDEDVNTIWHSQWSTATDPPHPHEIQLQLDAAFDISGIRYLPRQDGSANGTIANYEVYLSNDGANWGSAVATGTWANNGNWKNALFTPQRARYVRLVALNEVNGNPWTSAAEIEIQASACLTAEEVIGESGIALVDENWTTVNFQNTYDDPVVVSGLSASGQPDAVTARIRNVSSTSFEVRLEEWNCTDQDRLPENLPYVVMEAGIHRLLDGSTVIAGNEAGINHEWSILEYPKPFRANPLIFTQCVSDNQSTPVTTRIHHTGSDQGQFQVKVQEGTADPNAPHLPEIISWIALEPSTHSGNFSFESNTTGVAVDEVSFQLDFAQCYSDPVFLSKLSSYYGSDPAGVRFGNLGQASVDIFVEEEVCSDPETGHTQETIHYWVFNAAGNIYGRTMSLIQAKVLLQGPWNGTEMATGLQQAGGLPLMHPYSDAPWYYRGNECVETIPPDVVDWVLVQVRHAEDAEAVVAQRACFVRKDGTLIDLDGTEGVFFNQLGRVSEGYFSIQHRNHLGVATRFPISLR